MEVVDELVATRPATRCPPRVFEAAMTVHPRHGGLSFFVPFSRATPEFVPAAAPAAGRMQVRRMLRWGNGRQAGVSVWGSSVSSAGPLPSVIPNLAMR